MREKCLYCGKDLHTYDDDGNRLTRIDAKFDSDVCRDRYWADVRKIKRAFGRAVMASGLLLKLSTQDNDIARVADEHVNKLLRLRGWATEGD